MYERVLVPTDGSLTAQQAVEHAIDLAETHEADVHALMVVDPRSVGPGVGAPWSDWDEVAKRAREGAREDLDRAVEPIREAGIEVREALVEHEGVAEGILDYADEHDADVIAMGTHGRSGVERLLLGSVAERVVRKARRPVLLVPPKPVPGEE